MKPKPDPLPTIDKINAVKLQYPLFCKADQSTALNTSFDTLTQHSKDTMFESENLYENAIVSPRDFKINEFPSRVCTNQPCFQNQYQDTLMTRESLDIGIERKEDFRKTTGPIIRSITLTNKMNNVNKDDRDRNDNILNSYSKLFISKNKKAVGSLKPLRELKSPNKVNNISRDEELLLNNITNIKETIKTQKASIVAYQAREESRAPVECDLMNAMYATQAKGDSQELKDLDLEEEEDILKESEVEKGHALRIKKDKKMSVNSDLCPNALKNIENINKSSIRFESVLYNKPHPTMNMKKPKFPKNLKELSYKPNDENMKSPKVHFNNNKAEEIGKSRKKVVMKGIASQIKPIVLANKFSDLSKQLKRSDLDRMKALSEVRDGHSRHMNSRRNKLE